MRRRSVTGAYSPRATTRFTGCHDYDVADIVFPRVNRVGRFLKKDDVIAVNELLKLVFAIGINDKGALAVKTEGYGF